MTETIPTSYVHDLIRQAVAKSPYGDGIWGTAITERIMFEFQKAKIAFHHDPNLPDIPARRRADVKLTEFDF